MGIMSYESFMVCVSIAGGIIMVAALAAASVSFFTLGFFITMGGLVAIA